MTITHYGGLFAAPKKPEQKKEAPPEPVKAVQIQAHVWGNPNVLPPDQRPTLAGPQPSNSNVKTEIVHSRIDVARN